MVTFKGLISRRKQRVHKADLNNIKSSVFGSWSNLYLNRMHMKISKRKKISKNAF